jgi:hypothetical protein
MALRPRRSVEEHARLGTEKYHRLIHPLESANEGRVVALDLDSDAFEIADDSATAVKLLRARLPHADVYCRRIGRNPGVRH